MGPATWLAFYWMGVSLLTLVFYAYDKRAARRSGPRVPEKTLHLMSLAGGWPGALLGQRVLRHKTRKRPFQVVFWLTVVGNALAIVLILWAWYAFRASQG